MKSTVLLIVSLALLFLSVLSQANTVAKIEKLLLFEDGNMLYIYPKGGVQNPPACHGSNGDYISYKMDRPMAKEYLSMLMMAFTAKKNVSFRTAGACTDQSVSETLWHFTVYE